MQGRNLKESLLEEDKEPEVVLGKNNEAHGKVFH